MAIKRNNLITCSVVIVSYQVPRAKVHWKISKYIGYNGIVNIGIGYFGIGYNCIG